MLSWNVDVLSFSSQMFSNFAGVLLKVQCGVVLYWNMKSCISSPISVSNIYWFNCFLKGSRKLFNFSVSFGPVRYCFVMVDNILFAMIGSCSTRQVWSIISNYFIGKPMSHKVFNLSVIVVDNIDLITCISRYLEDESITPKLPK